MKLAFCLFKYFPYGGLQRDFLRIIEVCKKRGHEIHVYTAHWESDLEAQQGIKLHQIDVTGWQNHTRNKLFADQVKQALDKEHYDLVIGFNKMPYLDIYYAADICYQARIDAERSFLYRLLPRYRHKIAFEAAVFSAKQSTKILSIAPRQQAEFMRYYQTPAERFHLLPPGIAKDRIAPMNAAEIRALVRKQYDLAQDDIILLMVGSGFKAKGLDRAISAFASLSPDLKKRCYFFVIGQDNPANFRKLAIKLNVKDHVYFLGGRLDVPNFLLAADLLIHPAYHENTGTVLLEALAAGLPVLTVDVCGYAYYIKDAKAGLVLDSPFRQIELNSALEKMILSLDREQMRQNGLNFAKQADIYHLPEKAADYIEMIGRNRAASDT